DRSARLVRGLRDGHGVRPRQLVRRRLGHHHSAADVEAEYPELHLVRAVHRRGRLDGCAALGVLQLDTHPVPPDCRPDASTSNRIPRRFPSVRNYPTSVFVLTVARISNWTCCSTPSLPVPPFSSPHTTVTSLPSTAVSWSTMANEKKPPTLTV